MPDTPDLVAAKSSVLRTLAAVMRQYLGAQSAGIIMHDGVNVLVETVPEDAIKTMAMTPAGGLLLSVGDVGEQNALLEALRLSLDRVREAEAALEEPADA